ncbi:sugar transferase [Pelagovum pacificum]|uniref:sugar transferase n=1 Tax=Pelagovum pacificum TaxID=2588711 RepID=UPI0018CF27EE|nr:sugar transferase [Pelagovum pacificum]QQA43553.1 sugar transferase [Pelagovum pacificum]
MTDQSAEQFERTASGFTIVARRSGQTPVAAPFRKTAATALVDDGIGYVPKHPTADAIFNRGLAAVLLVLTSPIFAMIWIAQRVSSSYPAIYKGDRLGLHGEVFQILKFRTLTLSAAQATSGKTLPKRTQLETSFGSYLRKSRLDELPQLLNILRGDMVFFGPRPIRIELMPLYQAQVDDLDVRFTVRPGLMGLSQALMPHSASKRVRGRLVARACRRPVRYLPLVAFIARVGGHVFRRGVAGIFETIRQTGSPVAQHTFLRGGFMSPRSATVTMESGRIAALVGISDEVVQFVSTLPPETGQHRLTLSRKLRSGRVVKIDIDTEVQFNAPLGPGRSGIVSYARIGALTTTQQYRLDRYFLDQTVLPT